MFVYFSAHPESLSCYQQAVLTYLLLHYKQFPPRPTRLPIRSRAVLVHAISCLHASWLRHWFPFASLRYTRHIIHWISIHVAPAFLDHFLFSLLVLKLHRSNMRESVKWSLDFSVTTLVSRSLSQSSSASMYLLAWGGITGKVKGNTI